jgi:hypothetical protein
VGKNRQEWRILRNALPGSFIEIGCERDFAIEQQVLPAAFVSEITVCRTGLVNLPQSAAFFEATMESGETRKAATYNPEIEEENKRLRRLQIMMSMVMQVISEQSDLSLEEASELVASSRRAALNLFPGKELAYDLIYKPRLQRLMNERFHLQ